MAMRFGTIGADTLSGIRAESDYVSGGPSGAEATDTGADLLRGTGGFDTLRGWGGADTLIDGAGRASLEGGSGNDLILVSRDGAIASAGDGDDSIRGGADFDELSGDAGDDTIVGIGGIDVLNGGAGNDSIRLFEGYAFGGEGDDTIAGYGPSFGYLAGEDGHDRLVSFGTFASFGLDGGAGNDTLISSVTGELLAGGAGNDIIVAREGMDTLHGGAGLDLLLGGADADMFRFSAPTEGRDVIADFEIGLDKLAFSSFGFAGLAAGALEAANFVAHASHASTSAQGVPQFIYHTVNGNLSFDADGGGGVSVRIARLIDEPVLSASDLMIVA